eukprot:CAMPEP_0180658320 /NCGR_PEP_ID=MMETSP1037_2-20121125/56938_1 /TAXON_ID=632150 /ORGANISM="Azadinium spinosum, Strain 3D9" /LENGTH=381 /DNA_ID=CAMNT_0022685193 /DNA_START=31 /DNA_END=1176 /DNA_ORIENTATION=-
MPRPARRLSGKQRPPLSPAAHVEPTSAELAQVLGQGARLFSGKQRPELLAQSDAEEGHLIGMEWDPKSETATSGSKVPNVGDHALEAPALACEVPCDGLTATPVQAEPATSGSDVPDGGSHSPEAPALAGEWPRGGCGGSRFSLAQMMPAAPSFGEATPASPRPYQALTVREPAEAAQIGEAQAMGLLASIMDGVCQLGGLSSQVLLPPEHARRTLMALLVDLDRLADWRWPATAGHVACLRFPSTRSFEVEPIVHSQHLAADATGRTLGPLVLAGTRGQCEEAGKAVKRRRRGDRDQDGSEERPRLQEGVAGGFATAPKAMERECSKASEEPLPGAGEVVREAQQPLFPHDKGDVVEDLDVWIDRSLGSRPRPGKRAASS